MNKRERTSHAPIESVQGPQACEGEQWTRWTQVMKEQAFLMQHMLGKLRREENWY